MTACQLEKTHSHYTTTMPEKKTRTNDVHTNDAEQHPFTQYQIDSHYYSNDGHSIGKTSITQPCSHDNSQTHCGCQCATGVDWYLLCEVHLLYHLQCLVIIAEQAVQAQQADQAEVTQHLVKIALAKQAGYTVWVTCTSNPVSGRRLLHSADIRQSLKDTVVTKTLTSNRMLPRCESAQHRMMMD